MISYSLIELLKFQLITKLWRICLHLSSGFPPGSEAADITPNQSQSHSLSSQNHGITESLMLEKSTEITLQPSTQCYGHLHH